MDDVLPDLSVIHLDAGRITLPRSCELSAGALVQITLMARDFVLWCDPAAVIVGHPHCERVAPRRRLVLPSGLRVHLGVGRFDPVVVLGVDERRIMVAPVWRVADLLAGAIRQDRA